MFDWKSEREKLIADLRDAVSNIKTFDGMLPICAGCKKIRDDKGYWQQIEAYVSDRIPRPSSATASARTVQSGCTLTHKNLGLMLIPLV